MEPRFELRKTDDGSLTVFDRESGECYKSRHAARTEAEHVFFGPGVEQNPWYGKASPFRIVELGFGLGTNFLHLHSRNFQGELHSIERDLEGAKFFLGGEPNEVLAKLLNDGNFAEDAFHTKLWVGDFTAELRKMAEQKLQAHAIFFDPFSPKANPDAWCERMFRQVYDLLAPGGRLVTYSVSRTAKDSATAAGFQVEKHKLPYELKKRSAMLAIKPAT